MDALHSSMLSRTSNFITEAEAVEIRENKEERFRQYNDGRDPTLEELVDARPLAERIAEQRRIKEDAFVEATKLSGLIHKLDDDEVEFLSVVQEAGQLADQEARQKEAVAVDAFRRRQEQLDELVLERRAAELRSEYARPSLFAVKTGVDKKRRKQAPTDAKSLTAKKSRVEIVKPVVGIIVQYESSNSDNEDA